MEHRLCLVVDPPNPPHCAGIVPITWPLSAADCPANPRVLRIHFLNGTDEQRAQVKEVASEWLSEVCSRHGEIVAELGRRLPPVPRSGHQLALAFDFDAPAPGDVRILFASGPRSTVGFQATTKVPPSEPTMVLDMLDDPADAARQLAWRRHHILHQFGHMLGMVHTTQHCCGFELDVGLVEATFAGVFAKLGLPASEGVQFAQDGPLHQRSRYRCQEYPFWNGPFVDYSSITVYPLDPVWVVNKEDLDDRRIEFDPNCSPPSILSLEDLAWMLERYGKPSK